MALIIICLTTASSHAQIIPGGNPAHFGIDGDLKSDTFAFGTSMPLPVGSDDWFMKPGGTGLAMIDTTGAAYAKSILQTGKDFIFSMQANYPRFSIQNGNLLLDTRYARDGAMVDSTYFSGNAQNGQDPTTWPGSTGPGSPLDKCDIVDTYIHLRRDGSVLTAPNPSHLYLMLGASMVATNGSHYMDFELYKQQMWYDRVAGRFKNSGPTNTGGHTKWDFDPDGTVHEMGDMQVSFTFNSSSVSAINIYIWVSLQTYNSVIPKYFDFVPNTFIAGTLAGYGYAEITAKQPGAPLPVWGLVNATAIPAPSWGTTSKDLGSAGNNYYSTNYAPGQFAEIGIDFTALGTDPAFNPYNNPCTPPFTRVIAKTRSSASFSAALKDFTGPFPFVVDFTPPPAITIPGHLACNIPSLDLKPDTLVSPGVYEWSTSDGNITTSRTDTPFIKVNAVGTYVLKTRTFLGCSSRSDSVTIATDNNKPVAKGNGPYYVTTLNPIALLQGGDPAASNYSTPYGASQGLTWKWSGPHNYLTNTQYSDAADTGTYTLTITELRNGCTATAPATVVFLSTLPIKLNTFAAASLNKNTVDIKWSTSNEDGNEKYVLERSTNGISFSPVYNITAQTTSSLSNYGYRDDVTGLNSNVIYYRVKVYSHSALYSISNIVKINSSPDQLHNYISSVQQSGSKTNPVVSFYSTVNAPVPLKVVDVDGKILLKTIISAGIGANSIELPANKLNTIGIKFIQMAIQEDKLNYKFLFK